MYPRSFTGQRIARVRSDWSTSFPVDRGLLFMGPAGVGKTHLAVSIIQRLIEKVCRESFASLARY